MILTMQEKKGFLPGFNPDEVTHQTNPDLPGLEPTHEETTRAQRAFNDFAEQEWACPTPGCAKGSGDKTVFWNHQERKVKCTCCGWEDSRGTAEGRKLKRAAEK